MPNQRSKNKKHFTASVEKELFDAIETYASENKLDRNTALKFLTWQSLQSHGLQEAPAEYRVAPKKNRK
jgi:hypothetical protein